MELLEKYFDTAFAAPNGIKKLRELILTLAMQGKLVPQDLKDQPASELLKEIEAEKQRLVKEKKIKASKPLPEIKPEEMPYALPSGWEWVRLGNISEYIQRGKGPAYSDIREIPVISQKCVQWSGFDKNAVRFIDPTMLDKYQDERFIQSGDLLWNSTGTGTIGRINIYKTASSPKSTSSWPCVTISNSKSTPPPANRRLCSTQ
jgi:type I restriction enzyme S subunit